MTSIFQTFVFIIRRADSVTQILLECLYFKTQHTASLSPVVVDEGVSGLRAGVGAHGGHAAVHVDPQRNMVALEDGRLDVHHVTQEVNTGRPVGLPVL